MVNVFHIRLRARALFLALSEAFFVTVLLALAGVAGARAHAWMWLRYEDGFLRIGTVTALFLFCMYYYDLYDPLVLKSRRRALTRLPEVVGTVWLLLAVLYLIAPGFRLGLATVLLGISLAGLVVAVARNVFQAIIHSPRLAERFVLIGEGDLAGAVAVEIKERPELGIRLVPRLSKGANDAPATLTGEMDTLAGVVAAEHATGVILAADSTGGSRRQVRSRDKYPEFEVFDGLDFYETVTGKVWLDGLDPGQLPAASTVDSSPLLLVSKRIGSITLSFVGLLVTAPIMALIALVILLDSGKPVIFRQQRVGQHGRLFTLYKFRSMRNGRSAAFRPAQENDERFTRVGRWLRRTRLDELPQLWNILRGDMSFIGPRPFAWEEERQLAGEIPFYTQRWCVKPGATGWAQVHRGYCATREDNVEKLAYDLFYIKNLSIGLDLLILFQTTKVLLQGRGSR